MLFVEGRELVQILLAAGADPTAQDAQHGRTALHTAAMTNNAELVKVHKVAIFSFLISKVKKVHKVAFPLHLFLLLVTNGACAFLQMNLMVAFICLFVFFNF